MPFGYDIVCNFRAHTISQYNFEKGFTSMKTQKHLFLYAILVFAFSLCLFFLLPGMEIRAERAIDIARSNGNQLEERYQPAGSIIVEINTGQVLWQENPQISWEPASMSKLMTILLAYDAIQEGKFSLNTQVSVTDKYLDIASRYSLSNNKMLAGATYTVAELFDLIIVPSSAAATYMLADLIEPDPDKFVTLLNERAASIGMKNTRYYNPVGVPNKLLIPYQPVNASLTDVNVTTPEDYALLCCYFVKTYPDILNHTKYPKIVVKEGTPYEEKFDTYQYSIEGAKYSLKGTDGLKTGSNQNGFNYSSTALRGNTRLVEIVMGVSKWEDQAGEEIRHVIGNAIMEQAFQNFEYRKVLKKGIHTINDKKIEIKKDLWDCVPQNTDVSFNLDNGKVSVNLKREFLPGYQTPAVSYEAAPIFSGSAGSWSTIVIKVLLLIIMILLLLGCLRFYYVLLQRKKLRKRRMERRKLQNTRSLHDKDH